MHIIGIQRIHSNRQSGLSHICWMTILCLILCLASTQEAEAAHTTKLKISGSISNLTDSNSPENEFLASLGGSLGVGLNFDVHAGVNLQTELLLTLRGARRDLQIAGFRNFFEGSENIRIVYLEAPLLVMLEFPSITPRATLLYFGPTISLKLSGKVSGSISEQSSSIDTDFNIGISNLKTIVLGVSAGLEIPLTRDKNSGLFFDIRVNSSLTNTFTDDLAAKDPNATTYYFANRFSGKAFPLKNASISLTLGYLLGKK